MEEKKSRILRNIDVRFLYILPSFLALIFAITSFAYQFGNEVVDLKNTCYTIYLNTPEDKTVEEMIGELDEMLVKYDISGFTINLNTQGAYITNGEIQLDNSLQIAFMDISRDTVYVIAEALRETYGETIMIQEYVVKVSYL
jgi:hypothetical protein